MNIGSGNRQSDSRTVAAFHALKLHGSSEVLCRVGQKQGLVVEIDDNLLALIDTTVAAGVLKISSSEPYNSTQGLKVTIAVQSLLMVRIVGSAELDVAGLDETDFQIAIEGHGDVTAQGRASTFKLDVDGSGTCRCFDLAARDVSVSISGKGNVFLSVTNTISVEISGKGRVEYKGDPVVTQDISGAGTVVKV
jgi:hypothetical protein